jgi:serine/threonine protein kinase
MCPDTLLTKKYSHRNDIWGIGVIAYECLHGYHCYPWKFESF